MRRTERFLHSIEICMYIDIQRYADIGMLHQVLQAFHINTSLLHIGTEGMPQHMRRHTWKRIVIKPIDLALDALHIVPPSALQTEASRICPETEIHHAINDLLLFANRPGLYDSLQGWANGIRHWNRGDAAGGLGSGDKYSFSALFVNG